MPSLQGLHGISPSSHTCHVIRARTCQKGMQHLNVAQDVPSPKYTTPASADQNAASTGSVGSQNSALHTTQVRRDHIRCVLLPKAHRRAVAPLRSRWLSRPPRQVTEPRIFQSTCQPLHRVARRNSSKPGSLRLPNEAGWRPIRRFVHVLGFVYAMFAARVIYIFPAAVVGCLTLAVIVRADLDATGMVNAGLELIIEWLATIDALALTGFWLRLDF
jgi:hypothetical protein